MDVAVGVGVDVAVGVGVLVAVGVGVGVTPGSLPSPSAEEPIPAACAIDVAVDTFDTCAADLAASMNTVGSSRSGTVINIFCPFLFLPTILMVI